MAWPVIGKAFTPAEFKTYVQGLTWGDAFRPEGIALHNTASPSLAQRPDGLTHQQILNLQDYYKNTCKWNGGPHLFVDDKQIWVFNDLTKRGTHSPSWNATKIGIEMLGDFDCESFTNGRGRKVRDNAVAAMAILNNALGFKADAFKFHIEDKKTDHACPGKLARSERPALIAEINDAMAGTKAPMVVAFVDEDESHIDTKSVDLSKAEPEEPAPSASPPSKVSHLEAHLDLKDNSIWYNSRRWLLKTLGLGASGGSLGLVSSAQDDPLGTAESLLGFAKAHGMAIVGLILVAIIVLEVVQFWAREKALKQGARA